MNSRQKTLMTEEAYIIVSDRLRIHMALESLRGVTIVISEEDAEFLKQAICKLQLIEDRLFAQMEVTS